MLTVTSMFSDGILTVTGDNSDNEITLVPNSTITTRLSVLDGTNVIASYPFGSLIQINVDAGDGDDTIFVDDFDGSFSGRDIPMSLDGGNDDNLVIGSTGGFTLQQFRDLAAQIEIQQSATSSALLGLINNEVAQMQVDSEGLIQTANNAVFVEARAELLAANGEVLEPGIALAGLGRALMDAGEAFVADVQSEIVDDAQAIIDGGYQAQFEIQYAQTVVIPTAQNALDAADAQWYTEEFGEIWACADTVSPLLDEAIAFDEGIELVAGADSFEDMHPDNTDPSYGVLSTELESMFDEVEAGYEGCQSQLESIANIVVPNSWADTIVSNETLGFEAMVSDDVLADDPIFSNRADSEIVLTADGLVADADAFVLNAEAFQSTLEAGLQVNAESVEAMANGLIAPASAIEDLLEQEHSALLDALGAFGSFANSGFTDDDSNFRQGGCQPTTYTFNGGGGFDFFVGTGANDFMSKTSGFGIYLGFGPGRL